RYCQWVWQLRPLRQSPHAEPWSQLGQASQARRLWSASGSIGSTVHRPVRQHSGADQVVVVAPLLGIEVRVEHFVRLLFFGQRANRIPVVTDRLQHSGAPTDLVKGQVIGEFEAS